MGTTSRFGYRYPESTDEVDIPTDVRELAEDVEARTSRFFECTSTTRPTGVPDGFVISETDTGSTYKRLASAWVLVGGSGGGGGSGGTTASYRASATAVQSIVATSSGGGTVVALGVEDDTDPLVTRAVSGDGHAFTLGAAGIWHLQYSVRVAASTATGEVSLDMRVTEPSATERSIGLDGGRREGLPRSLTATACQYLAANSVVLARIFNGTGSTRTLEPNAGNWVHFSAALIG